MIEKIKNNLFEYEMLFSKLKKEQHDLKIKVNQAKKLVKFNVNIDEEIKKIDELDKEIKILISIIRRYKNVIDFYTKNDEN